MASNSSLQAVPERGWLQGFGNLTRKENRRWWRTGQWLWQTLIWLALVNGMLALVIIVAPQAEAAEAQRRTGEVSAVEGLPDQPPLDQTGLMIYFTFSGLAIAVGVVILGQEAVILERQTGTAAWVLSKPVSRSAFLLSKLAANALGILVTMVLAQGAVAYGLLYFATGTAYPVGGFLGGMALVYLTLLFYLALTLMLGTLVNSRGAVIGLPLLLIFGYQLFLGLAPWLMAVMPWALTMTMSEAQPAMALTLAQGQPVTDWLPAIATALWTVVFVGVAVWRFEREDF
mgnify:CR=1 FL=1